MLTCKSVSGIAIAIIVAVPSALLVPTDGWAQIEEIIVTTRRREENLQEVPIAVTAISAEMIQRQNINSMFDVANLDPSVQMDTSFTPADTRITIRGLTNTRGRSNVAILIDGIDVTTENVIAPGGGMLANQRLLTDLERIEVVKGPQSALYGRAAFAGAISYTTKDPGDELSAKIGVEVGDYGIYQLTGSVDGPISDTFGLRADGVVWSGDGFYDNAISGADVGGGEGYGLSLTGVYEPGDAFKLKFRAAYSDDEFDPRPNVIIPGDSQEDVTVYPQSAINAGLGTPSAFELPAGSGNGTSTGLVLFDLFCPRGPNERGGQPLPPGTSYDPATDSSLLSSSGPGFCVPRTMGNADGLQPTFSENTLTGGEYPGSTMELFRSSLVMSWDIGADGGGGTLSSYTGYTDADTSDFLDQDLQARGRPDTLLVNWQTKTETNTEQFSQEIRWASNFDGPVQLTVGGLYWDQSLHTDDQNYIINCMPYSNDSAGSGGSIIGPMSGICDGTAAPPAFGIPNPVSVASWQEYADQLNPIPVQTWDADTEHWSIYMMLEWNIIDQLKLTLENRYVNEDFEITKPNQSGCTKLGWRLPAFFNAAFPLAQNSVGLNPGDPGYENALCGSVDFDEAGDICMPGTALPPGCNTWAVINGSEDTTFNAPKVTVEWTPSDNALLFFSWAHAEKPGGISQISSGGTASTIEDERFLPEKMDAWELGTKTTWEAAGGLQVNGSVFFNDYTDKQVGTQILVPDPSQGGALISQPRVINAAAAEVWGVELDLLWQPSFLEGLSISFAYTWLDPTYTDFIDETSSVLRAAQNGSCPIVYTGRQNPANPDDKTDITNGGPKCALNMNGHQLERTPENSFVSMIGLQRPLFNTGIDWFIEGNTTYQDKRFESVDNWTYFEDYWLTDIRLGLQADRWDALVYVNNAFDDDTVKSGGSQPEFGEQNQLLGFTAGLGTNGWQATLPAPRVVGVRANFRFGN